MKQGHFAMAFGAFTMASLLATTRGSEPTVAKCSCAIFCPWPLWTWTYYQTFLQVTTTKYLGFANLKTLFETRNFYKIARLKKLNSQYSENVVSKCFKLSKYATLKRLKIQTRYPEILIRDRQPYKISHFFLQRDKAGWKFIISRPSVLILRPTWY